MTKRCIALVLGAVLALASVGCAIQLEESAVPSPLPAPDPSELDLTPRINIEVSLYFLSSAKAEFATETRTIFIEQNASPELAIVNAIIDGPAVEGLLPVATGFAADRVEVMPDLINVYLTQQAESVRQWNLTIMKLAMSAALIDYSGVRYVNVLVNGEERGYVGSGTDDQAVPTGPASWPGDLSDELNMLAQRAAAESYDAYAALYFLDESERWLLPEMKRVTVRKGTDSVNTLVKALFDGPENVYSLRRSLDPQLELLSHEFVEASSGARMLRLVFNRIPTVYTKNFIDGEQMAAAALAYTLTSFIPNIRGVELADRTNPVRVVTCVPSDYADLIGNRISVYLPNTPGGATLTNVERVVAQAHSNDLFTILETLFRGPIETDARDVWPAAPEGISARSVLDVYRAEDLIVVNLDGAVAGIIEDAGVDDERVLLFSIVNTLTNLKGVRSVLFLVEGERCEYLGLSAICVLDPIMRNPGIIR